MTELFIRTYYARHLRFRKIIGRVARQLIADGDAKATDPPARLLDQVTIACTPYTRTGTIAPLAKFTYLRGISRAFADGYLFELFFEYIDVAPDLVQQRRILGDCLWNEYMRAWAESTK